MGLNDDNSTGIPRAPAYESKEESEIDANEEPVELLVNTRTKRSTAGNRLHSLLQQQEPDDELELIFAEDEEDTGFHDLEDQSDVPMDSSSDEEDKEPETADNLEGEKELQKTIKAAKIKNRKNRNGKYKNIKKIRIDSESTQPPRKRPERVSWLPSPNDAPIRASSRQTTRQSKQQLQVQMMDREIKRLKQLANMEKAAAAKVAKETPPLTQEDRLKEAARVEKANAKSLSRWERAEREREEEQRLRLTNLHNRHLEGPVITIWSGMATYIGGKLQKIGKLEILPEKPALKKRKAADNEGVKNIENFEDDNNDSEFNPKINGNQNENSINSPKLNDNKAIDSMPDSEITPTIKSQAILQAPSSNSAQSPTQYSSTCLAPPAGLPLTAPSHPFLAPPAFNDSTPPSLGYYSQQKNNGPNLPKNLQSHLYVPRQNLATSLASSISSPSIITEHCLRTSLIFTNFSENAIKSRETQLNILFPHIHQSNNISSRTTSLRAPTKGSRTPRASQKSFSCAITNYPAKYKDPKTGLYYSNLYAYKQLQKLQKGEIWWSDLVGSFVGSGSLKPAKGVPDKFRGEIKSEIREP